MDNLREKFLKEREELYNGEIIFISFAKYIGNTLNEERKNLNGLIYIINDHFYFEDFKPQPSPLLIRNNNNYEKTELVLLKNDILKIINVKESDVNKFFKGLSKLTEIQPLTNKIDIFFHKALTQIILNNSSYFFDITENKKFIKKISTIS